MGIIFTYKGRLEEADYLHAFVSDTNEWLFISSFEDGVAIAEPYAWIPGLLSPYDYICLVTTCFDEASNFEQELKIAFRQSADTPFNEVDFELEGSVVVVTKEMSDPDILYELWENDI